jgi:hypothetical protein
MHVRIAPQLHWYLILYYIVYEYVCVCVCVRARVCITHTHTYTHTHTLMQNCCTSL